MSARYRPFRSIHRVLADPLRLRLLDGLWAEPRSAKELAAWIGIPADRLYYHLHRMERAGLVQVIRYRDLPAGKVEKVYGIASVEPPGDDATPEEMAEFLGQALQATRADINLAYQAKARGADRQVMLHRGGARLSLEQFSELKARLLEVIRAAVENSDPNGVPTGVLVTLVDLQDRNGPSDQAEGELGEQGQRSR